MSRGRHATPVKLAKKERQELLSLIGRKTAAQRDVMRARIALLAHEGHSNSISNSIVNQSSTATRRWNEPVGDPVQGGEASRTDGVRAHRYSRIRGCERTFRADHPRDVQRD